MKNSEKLERAFYYFKKSYSYKMGGTQTVILPNGKSREFDDREYYSGRGEKYNANIRHDEIGIVKVTRKEYSAFLKRLREEAARWKENERNYKESLIRIAKAKEKGVYSLEKADNDTGYYVELSEEETYGKFFDAERLAKTLDIEVKDAELLKSGGKTYVFARQHKTNKILQLFHPALSCNPLKIHCEEVSEERMKEFNHDKWANAPYAHMVGQTLNKNHFVC